MPSCEPAVLRPGYAIREIFYKYEPWLPYGHPFYSPKVGPLDPLHLDALRPP